jgi:molecular chaperone DnaJ
VTRTLEVNVPAGVDNGSQIRLTGEGELGTNGGPRGSCYVVLRVGEHSIFERIEDDLHVQLNISFAQAALGDEVMTPTLEGEEKVKVAAGIESGEVITLRNKGVARLRGGGRGNLYIHVQVTTPKKLSSEQKKLLEQLSQSMEKDNGDKGLFEKVKGAFG